MKQENYLYRLLSIDYLADGASAELEFLPECPVYKGHFPGLPITPGVLLLTVVREIVEKIVGNGCEIESVRNVKFLQVLTTESNPVRVVISELELVDGIDGTSGIDGTGKINCIGEIDIISETDSEISGAERSREIRTIRAKASIVSCIRNEQEDGGDGRALVSDDIGQGNDGRGQGECTTFAKMSITLKTTRQ